MNVPVRRQSGEREGVLPGSYTRLRFRCRVLIGTFLKISLHRTARQVPCYRIGSVPVLLNLSTLSTLSTPKTYQYIKNFFLFSSISSVVCADSVDTLFFYLNHNALCSDFSDPDRSPQPPFTFPLHQPLPVGESEDRGGVAACVAAGGSRRFSFPPFLSQKKRDAEASRCIIPCTRVPAGQSPAYAVTVSSPSRASTVRVSPAWRSPPRMARASRVSTDDCRYRLRGLAP